MAQVPKKVLADMHVPPALRRWTVRLVLALAVALAIAYAPGNSEGQAQHLRRQLEDARREARELEAENARLAGEVDALRTDPRAVEARARNELGMVYPGEIVLRLEGVEAAP
jgi:cell division protein FtsB